MIFLKAFLKLSVLQTNKMFVNLSAEPYYFFFCLCNILGEGETKKKAIPQKSTQRSLLISSRGWVGLGWGVGEKKGKW